MPDNENSRENKNVPAENNHELDLYNDDKTKEIVSKLFDEFAGEGETNYFADVSDSFMDSDNDEEESLGDSIARRRKRNGSSAKKSIVFRKKAKKHRDDEFEESDEDTSVDKAENENGDAVKEPPDLEKTIILPKLSNFFKKSSYDKDEDEDDIDDFFADLARDSAKRSRQAVENEAKNETISREDNTDHSKEAVAASEDEENITTSKESEPRKRYGESAFENFKSVYDSSDEEVSDDDENDDSEDDRVVEIGVGRIITIAAFAVCVIAIVVLVFSNINYSRQLDEARSQITELQKNSSSTYETELEELKQRVADLTSENESLIAASADADDPHTAAVQILNEAQSEIASEESTDTSLSQGESAGNTYTVKAGDTFWSISQSVYGNGAEYQKILDANGMTENSVLNEGQVLNIPN